MNPALEVDLSAGAAVDRDSSLLAGRHGVKIAPAVVDVDGSGIVRRNILDSVCVLLKVECDLRSRRHRDRRRRKGEVSDGDYCGAIAHPIHAVAHLLVTRHALRKWSNQFAAID